MSVILDLFISTLVGAGLAFGGNRLALMMVFKPYEKLYFKGRPIPFTPGALVSKQKELAGIVADMVVSKIITPDNLKQTYSRLTSGVTEDDIYRALMKYDFAKLTLAVLSRFIWIKMTEATEKDKDFVAKEIASCINHPDRLPAVIKENIQNMPPQDIESAFMTACGPELKKMAYAEAAMGAVLGFVVEVLRQLIFK